MSKRRISFVTSTLNSGGSERVISLLANVLQERGHEVEIVNINRHEVFYEIHPKVRLTFVEEACGSTFIGKKMLWMRKHLKSSRPDVVIPFMTDVECVTLLSLLGIGIPVISSERYDPRASTMAYKTMRWLFLRMTNHLVVQTEEIKSFYSKALQKRTTVIYNPVREDVFLNVSIGNQHPMRIVSVGRLAPQKNFPMLIMAFGKIHNLFPDFQLVIFGEGPLRDDLESMVHTMNLDGKVLLPGRSEKIVEELRSAALFCMSTNAEGMSNAMIEAMCVGLPVVSTDVCGAKELLSHPESGFIVPVGDVDSMARAMKNLLSNESLMKQMGERNRAKAGMFRKDSIVEKWETLICKVT